MMPAVTDITATELQALGRSLIPVNLDKKPLFPWIEYQHRRATEEEINGWAMRKPAAWAMVTGAVSGIITLDFDGPAGVETMKGLGIEPHRISGSGGYHADFIHPGWPVKTLNCKSKRELGERWPGLDIRADGGYVIVMGRNRNGEYRLLRDPATLNRLDALPDDLRAFLGLLHAPEEPGDCLMAADGKPTAAPCTEPSRNRAAVPVVIPITDPGPVTLPGGTENAARIDPQVLIGAAFEKVNGGMGRNDAGFWLCCQLRDNGFLRSEAAAFATQYAGNVPPVNTKGQAERYSAQDFTASLRQAYQRPARQPWDVSGGLEPEPEPDTETSEDDGDELRADILEVAAPRAVSPDSELASRVKAGESADAAGPARTEDVKCGVAAQLQVSEREKQKARALLKQALDLDFVQVVKHGESDGFHVAHLADGRKVDLGRTAKFASEGAVRIAVIDGLGSQLPPIKKGAWRKILNAMLTLVVVEAGLTPLEMTSEWVESLLNNSLVLGCPSLKAATPEIAYAFDVFNGTFDSISDGGSCLYETGPDGVVVLKLRRLYRHVTIVFNAKLSQPDLAVLLARAGFRKYTTFNGPMWKGERLRVQRVWVGPASKFHLTDAPRENVLSRRDSPRYDPDITTPSYAGRKSGNG